MTNEIGSAAAGGALFTLGPMSSSLTLRVDREALTNVAVKNVLQPALLPVGGLALGLRGLLLHEVFLIDVPPSGTLIPALAHNNRAHEDEAPLVSMASTLLFIVSISVGIAVARAAL